MAQWKVENQCQWQLQRRWSFWSLSLQSWIVNINSWNFCDLHQLLQPLLALEWPQALSGPAAKVPKIILSWYDCCVMVLNHHWKRVIATYAKPIPPIPRGEPRLLEWGYETYHGAQLSFLVEPSDNRGRINYHYWKRQMRKASAAEAVRLDWMRRFRPKPHWDV